MPPCAEDVMIGICCPDGESGLVLAKLGERPVAAAAAARLFLGMYGVYVVCGPAAGCRGGGRTGPGRGGGGKACSGEMGLEGIGGVPGGERKLNELADVGLAVAGEPFEIGNRSG